MSIKRFFAVFLTILFLSIALAIFLYYSQEKRERKELVLYGNVDVRQVDISFRVAGQVETLFFEEGDLISPHDLLATLDRSPYDKQLEEAKATVDSIAYNLENAEKILQRRIELIGNGSVSQEDLDNALSTRNQLRANFEQAKAAHAVAELNLSYTQTFSPTEGVILSRVREPGTVVNPTDPVYTVSVSSPVWVRAFVPEPYLGLVNYGMKARIFTDTPGALSYVGTVGFISPVAEFTPKTVETTELRTDLVYRLRIYVDNPDGGLRQGMPVTVKMEVKNQRAQSRE